MDKLTQLCYSKFLKADAIIKENKITEALQELEEIIEINPSFGRAYNHIGWIYETKFQDYKNAEINYRLALQHAPEYPAVYYNFAVLLSAMRRFEELEALLNSSKQVPGIIRSTILNEFGIMHEMQANYALAIDYYREAIMNAVDNKAMETFSASIERCNNKMNLNNKANRITDR